MSDTLGTGNKGLNWYRLRRPLSLADLMARAQAAADRKPFKAGPIPTSRWSLRDGFWRGAH